MTLEKIKDDMYARQIGNRYFSEKFEVHHTTIGAMLANKRAFDFAYYVRILNDLYPNDADFMRYCIRKLIPRLTPKNTRLALDVLNLYGELEMNKNLMIKSYTSDDRINKKLTEWYYLLYLRSSNSISAKDFFAEVEDKRKSFKMTAVELRIVADICLIYAFLGLSNFRAVSEYTQSLLLEIKGMKHNTLQQTYSLRVREMLSFVKLKNNDLEEAREECWGIINDPHNFFVATRAAAYCTIGESYIFTDYNKARQYMKLGIKELELPINKKQAIRKKEIQNTLNFLNILWEMDLESVGYLSPAEQAFLYAKTGRKSEAVTILEQLKVENGSLSAFQLYYMGLAIEDKRFFEQSVAAFKKSNDFFYIQLPILQLL